MIVGIFLMEVGCVNLMILIVVVVKLGIFLVDCDGMGWVFLELFMVMFYLNGMLVIFMVIIDEKGNIGIMEMIDNIWIECFVCV